MRDTELSAIERPRTTGHLFSLHHMGLTPIAIPPGACSSAASEDDMIAYLSGVAYQLVR